MYDNVTIECIPETMGKGITWVIMKGKLPAKIRGPRVLTLSRNSGVDLTQQVWIVTEEAKKWELDYWRSISLIINRCLLRYAKICHYLIEDVLFLRTILCGGT